MIAIHLLLASASVLRGARADSLSLHTGEALVNNIVVPKEISNFAKDGASAQWASGYPKEWGSENYHYQFNEPDPEDSFSAGITPDEKYLAMNNGTHITFINLEKNTTASTLALVMPKKILALSLTLRHAPQGGYDVFASGSNGGKNGITTATVRIRVSSNLTAIGNFSTYQGGIGAISKQGRLASLSGYIYDMEGTDTPIATLTDRPDLTDLSFSPDGIHLASVSWRARTADLWNATSGQKIYQFPATNAQNWVTRFSPDGRYLAIAVGSNNNTIQLYTLGNLTAPPTEMKVFNGWPRALDWSPDSKTLAVADENRLRIFNVPSGEVIQTWEVEGVRYGPSPSGVSFLAEGKRLTWTFLYGTYLYEFETNTKWYWVPRAIDHIWGGMGFSFLSKTNVAVTHDGDSTVRFWKI
ncbi:prolyl oligopeptidase [Ophiobolus disseminans]|uniref:Prolyl oligopeptidase n=1 Tax=Ophiobolus disseminans TaxID=1469910 RepID=A0A6A7ADN5_9PLEO|nr:prolyl oligopeptidase [Ophiobolus disseminans]